MREEAIWQRETPIFKVSRVDTPFLPYMSVFALASNII